MVDPPGSRGHKPSPLGPEKKLKNPSQPLSPPTPTPSSNNNKKNKNAHRELQDRLEKLVKHLQRQFAAQRPSEQHGSSTGIRNDSNSSNFLVPPRPPDLAASNLGRELADAFYQSFDVTEDLEHIRKKVLQSLKQRGIHPSLPHAFFDTLVTLERSSNNNDITDSSTATTITRSATEWLPTFLLECESTILQELPNIGSSNYEEAEISGVNETLSAAMRAFAACSSVQAMLAHQQQQQQQQTTLSYQQPLNDRSVVYYNNESINTTYRRLTSSASRTLLLREFSRAVKDLNHIPRHLSPLMASCVLALWATPDSEKMLLLREIWRTCWDTIYASSNLDQFWGILYWMTEALHIFLLVLPSATRLCRDERPAWRELAQEWFMVLGDMIAFVVHATQTDDDDNSNNHSSAKAKSRKTTSNLSSERMLAEWLLLVLNRLLPLLSTQGAGSYRLSLEPFLEQLNGLIVEMDDSLVQLNTLVVFRLSTMALTTPLVGETKSILTLFSYLLPSESAFARGLTSSVGAIYMDHPSCQQAAKHLLKTAQGMDQQLMGLSDRTNTYSVVQLLEEGDDGEEVLKFLSSCVDASELENLSAAKQVEVLLLGISLMEIVGNDDLQCAARSFVKKLLQKYPHLGLLLMPSLIADINAAAVEKTPNDVLSKVQFLADSVTVDPTCAQQAWNLLGIQMLEPDKPVVLRVMILRLLPRLCLANKRLYRRVMDTLGAHRTGKPTGGSDPEALTPDSMTILTEVIDIRIAVAASITDLAKDDLIRDTSDCIGWIQEFLVEDYSKSPEKTLLVHYAIMTLHYLVIAHELDFNLVLKVLKKKLCPVTSIDDVQHLPPVIQEALALLLGDGECDGGSSSEEVDKADNLETPAISAQVVGAVQVLIDLGTQYETVKPDEGTSMELIARIRRNIYYSLSRYSLDALGLDEDGIKAAIAWKEQVNERSDEPPVLASRYVSLRQLAVIGIQLPAGVRGMVEDFETILREFTSKMLRFEEEALSSSLWATKGTRHHVQQRRGEAGKASAKEGTSLPAPSKLQSIHKQMPSASSSLARLLCFEGKGLSKFLALAGEVSFEEREPSTLVFLVQAWLNSCSRLLSQFHDGTRVKGLNQALEEIKRWGQHTGNNDAMYLTMAAISVYFPNSDDKDDALLVEQIRMEVFEAFKSLDFRNADISKISLSLIAINAVRDGKHERASDIMGVLEQTVKGYGGQLTFGAAYGLALIAQAVCKKSDRVQASSADAVKSGIGRVTGFLAEELLQCTEATNDRCDVLATLIACLQSGVSTPGLVNSLADLVSQQFSMIPTKIETAKYLFIALGLCLPALSRVNGDLLLGTLFLLERFQWGSGKGVALVPVLAEAKTTGVLTEDEYNVIVTDYSRLFEQGRGGSGENMHSVEDLFYALNGTSAKPSPAVIRQFLTQTSHTLDDSRVISPIISAVVSISSFPCLGFGTKVFSTPPQLRAEISSSTVDNVLEVLKIALDAHVDYSTSDYSQNAVMVMGLLASMKNQPSDIISLAPTKENVSQSRATSKLKSLNLDFALLPSAQQGTVLSDMMRLIQDTHKSHTADMVRFVECLEFLSLPGHFAKHFLEPLISEDNDRTKEGCVSLLAAQICGRRKAVFEGKDFTNIALQICIMPLVSFNALLGSGKASLLFVKCLEGVARALPTELVENGAGNLWEVCLSLSTDETGLLVNYLKSIQNILKGQKKGEKQSPASPKTMTFLEQFVSTKIFSDLRELSWCASIGENNAAEETSILKAYVACLKELPLASLEQFDVFAFQEDDSFSGEVLRTLVILELVKDQYFKDDARATLEYTKVLAWFSRKFVMSGAELYLETLRRISCALAAATSILRAPERREILLFVLEQLLLCQPSAAVIGLDLLSILLASWCSDVATDGDLSMAYVCIHSTDKLQSLSDNALGQMFSFFRHDLCFNLSTYGRKEKISAIIANQVWRLYTTWSRHDADQEVLQCLKRTFICGSSSETKEEDFVALTCSILLQANSFRSVHGLLR